MTKSKEPWQIAFEKNHPIENIKSIDGDTDMIEFEDGFAKGYRACEVEMKEERDIAKERLGPAGYKILEEYKEMKKEIKKLKKMIDNGFKKIGDI